MELEEPRRQITIHGLISHYGTARAKLCANYLHNYLPSLYKKPKIYVYFDEDWIDYMKKVRNELGDIHRKLWYLKYPVIVFFNDKYVGDHRTIIQYVTSEYGVVPDLPLPDLFPDFTQFIPKRRNKAYTYLDIRVGDLNDYVVGKMVFELHTDIVPETCKFFEYLCEAFGEYQFSEPQRKWKFSYLGTKIRRICGNSFIQGGSIPEATLLRVRDENFIVKHDRRGVISIANQGGNRSTTEFAISLKPNPFMDRTNVAFGQLIFGEPVLAAIEEVPTYYQSPLKEIVVVGCGVIPNYDLWDTVDFETSIIKEKQKIISEVQELKKKKEQFVDFKKNVKQMLTESEREKSLEFIYTDKNISDPDIFTKETWTNLWIRDTCLQIEEGGEESPGELDNLSSENEQTFEMDEELRSDVEEECKLFEKSLGTKVFKDFTIEKLLTKSRRKDIAMKKKMMHGFVCSFLEKMFENQAQKEPIELEDFPVKHIEDVLDIHDAPSEINQVRYEAGLYSLPKCLKKTVVETFEKLSTSQLKLLGEETRELLKEADVSDETLSLFGSEEVLSGLLIAVTQSELIKQDFFESQQEEPSGSVVPTPSKDLIVELAEEIINDIIRAIKVRGQDFIENILVYKESQPQIVLA